MTYVLNGKKVSREEFTAGARKDWLKGAPMVADTYSEHDPLISDGCGVMKNQVSDTREAIKYHGIQGAEITNTGQVRFTSRRARRDFLRMRGLVDNDGTYGDG